MDQSQFFNIDSLKYGKTNVGEDCYKFACGYGNRCHIYIFPTFNGTWKALKIYPTQPSGAADPYDVVYKLSFAYEFACFDDLVASLDVLIGNADGYLPECDVTRQYPGPGSKWDEFDVYASVEAVDGVQMSYL